MVWLPLLKRMKRMMATPRYSTGRGGEDDRVCCHKLMDGDGCGIEGGARNGGWWW